MKPWSGKVWFWEHANVQRDSPQELSSLLYSFMVIGSNVRRLFAFVQ